DVAAPLWFSAYGSRGSYYLDVWRALNSRDTALGHRTGACHHVQWRLYYPSGHHQLYCGQCQKRTLIGLRLILYGLLRGWHDGCLALRHCLRAWTMVADDLVIIVCTSAGSIGR